MYLKIGNRIINVNSVSDALIVEPGEIAPDGTTVEVRTIVIHTACGREITLSGEEAYAFLRVLPITTPPQLIMRAIAESIVRKTSPETLLIMAAQASSPDHHGRAELNLETGELVLGFAEADGSDGEGYQPCHPYRITLWLVPAGAVESATGYGHGDIFIVSEGENFGEFPNADDIDRLGAEVYASQHPPDRSAQEVLDDVKEALDAVYGVDAC